MAAAALEETPGAENSVLDPDESIPLRLGVRYWVTDHLPGTNAPGSREGGADDLVNDQYLRPHDPRSELRLRQIAFLTSGWRSCLPNALRMYGGARLFEAMKPRQENASEALSASLPPFEAPGETVTKEDSTNKVKLWLDDIRVPPDETWTWVKLVEEAQALFADNEVTHASLDHDLGEGNLEGRRLVLWMAENDVWPTQAISVHSGNPVGVEYMTGVIERYGPFRRVHAGGTRFVRQPGDGGE